MVSDNGFPPLVGFLCAAYLFLLYKLFLSLFCSSDTLALARQFSARNGYGPVPLLPVPGAPQWAAELGTLLGTLTCAEEAAIRQVTPLLSVIRLAHGNIGVRGNVSCVWQKSKLNRVLPNLPSQCSTIVIERERRGGSVAGRPRLRSQEFKRVHIERTLRLLARTGLAAWDIIVSGDHLSQWPESGNLLHLGEADIPTVLEVEDHTGGGGVDLDGTSGTTTTSGDDVDSGGAGAPHNHGLIHDGLDMGPAPLQNGEEPEEVFEGVTARC